MAEKKKAKKKPKVKVVKATSVKLVIYMENMGDGSSCARFFNTTDKAEEYAANHDERFCDDIYCKELLIDENGKLLNPDVRHNLDGFDESDEDDGE